MKRRKDQKAWLRISGRCVEFTFPLGTFRGPRRPRMFRSSDKRKKQNFVQAVRRLASLINANFQVGDCFFALTYADTSELEKSMPAGLDPDRQKDFLCMQAYRSFDNFRRRLERACKKKGIECKYIVITSMKDPDTKEDERVHHHIVVTREMRDLVIEKWRNGFVYDRFLDNSGDYTGIAAYMLDQAHHLENGKRYRHSLSVVMPEQRVVYIDPVPDYNVPPKSVVVERNERYVRYVLPVGGHLLL